MFVILINVLVVVVIIWMTITQIILPAIKGLPIFPLFRKKKVAQLEKEMADARQDLENEETLGSIDRVKSKEKSLREKRRAN